MNVVLTILRVFLSNCSNFSARCPKKIKKTIFLQIFSCNFFCISRLFLRHSDFFLSNDKKSCSKSKTDEQIELFQKKLLFPRNASGRADCSCDNPGKKYGLSVFWIKVRKSVKDYINIKKSFSPKISPDTYNAGFVTLAKIFARSNNRSESEKKRIFLFWKKNFHKLFPRTYIAVLPTLKKFSAIVPKTSKFIQKSLSFQEFLSEMLRRKCSSGNVESSFDNPATNFPVKMQFFLVKFRKRRKTIFSRVFFWRFSLCTLDYCFDTTDKFFCRNQKKLTQSPKRDDDSINCFCHFFSKFCWGHVKCTFSNTAKCHIFLAKRRFFFAQRLKTIKQILFFQKKRH